MGNFRKELGTFLFTFCVVDEWENFLERINRGESSGDVDFEESSSDNLELRFWVSYRGQTLARTGQNCLLKKSAPASLYQSPNIVFFLLWGRGADDLFWTCSLFNKKGKIARIGDCRWQSINFSALNAVRGMMYYRRALMLQSFMERRGLIGIMSNTFGFET